jgi:hypothetical protein
MAGARGLKVIPGISSCRPDIFPHIPPERKDDVNDDGRAHREQGSVHKVLADTGRGDSHSVTDGGTNAKGIPFHEILETVHSTNLQRSLQAKKL